MGTSSQMKKTLQEEFSFDCKCGVCSGSIPHQDRLFSEISAIIALLSHQPLDYLYQKEKEEWMNEASQLERAADLAKQLYIGRGSDRSDGQRSDSLAESHGPVRRNSPSLWTDGVTPGKGLPDPENTG